ncbi:MAG: ATP-binding protein, partial [Alphaproteobacteria bacterium]|nr:ATP-binding protein [Alphaproteobacteria bacterium]
AMREVEQSKSRFTGLTSPIYIRPLLDIPKDILKNYLQSLKVEWVEDPSNEMDKFDRVKMRQNASAFRDVGLTAGRLSRTAKIMSDTALALDWAWQRHMSSALELYPVGCIRFSKSRFLEMPAMLQARLASLMLMSVSGHRYPPDLEKLTNFMDKINIGVSTTLHGGRTHLHNDDCWIGRETRNEPPSFNGSELGAKGLPFRADYELISARGLRLASIGHGGWKAWSAKFQKTKKNCIYPAFIRLAVPALFCGEELVGPVAPLFREDASEVHDKTAEFKVRANFLKEFDTFTFSTDLSDTI